MACQLTFTKYAGKESVIKECEDSLRRLQTDYIDLYQIHWPDSTTPIEETMEAVAQLLKEGKIRASGICNYSAEQMKTAGKVVKQVTNQVPYSVVERHIKEEITPYCVEASREFSLRAPCNAGCLRVKLQTTIPLKKMITDRILLFSKLKTDAGLTLCWTSCARWPSNTEPRWLNW